MFGFVDAARLWNRDAGFEDATLRSAGIGARAYTRLGQFAVTWAMPRTGTYSGGDKPDARLLFTYNHTFSIR